MKININDAANIYKDIMDSEPDITGYVGSYTLYENEEDRIVIDVGIDDGEYNPGNGSFFSLFVCYLIGDNEDAGYVYTKTTDKNELINLIMELSNKKQL